MLLRARHHTPEIVGMYFGTDARLGLNHCQGYLFSETDYRSKSIVRSAPLTESLLASAHLGSAMGYRSAESGVEPEFRPALGGESAIEPVRTRALERYADLFIGLSRNHAFLEEELLEHGAGKYFELVTRPDAAFLDAMREVEFRFDWGDPDAHKLIVEMSAGDMMLPWRLAVKLWHNPWIFGSLKAGGLGLLARPVTWLHGIDQRITRRLRNLIERQ